MRRLNQSGLTIVELMISISIAGILAAVLLAVSLTFFGDTIRGQTTSEMIVDSHFATRTLTEDLRLGSKIGTINTLGDANAPAGGWSTSDATNTLIISTPAVTADNQVIYNTQTGDPYENEVIYFLQDGILYKRQLSNPSAGGNNITTTCPLSLASSGCPADRQYASHINDLVFTFYDFENNETADPALAVSVKVDMSLSRQVYGQTVNFTNSTYTKLRN